MATDSLFFAVFPDAQSAQRLHELAGRLSSEAHSKARPPRLERLHVTVVYLGGFMGAPPEDLIRRATKDAEQIRHPAFEIEMAHVGCLGRGHRNAPVVIRSDERRSGIHDFERHLAEALSQGGITVPDTRPYRPHVTLLRPRSEDRALQGL